MTRTAPLPLVAPPRLDVGARVALVSPSGPLGSVAELTLAEGHARVFGWETVVGAHAMSRDGYFAGTDAQRGADLAAAIADPTIDAIWCLRGGYGATRLLPAIDLHAIAAQPKTLIGYSDITALHSAWARAGVMSFHGPTARSTLTPFTRESLVRAVSAGEDSAGTAHGATCIRGGRAVGRLTGGNLAVAAALCGTPWALSFRDAIVVLEDINEATYRIDRTLTQLRHAGAFDGCVGLALGHFTDSDKNADEGDRLLDAVVRELADALQVPTLLGIPIGHIEDQWTLPFGGVATLDADAGTLCVHR